MEQDLSDLLRFTLPQRRSYYPEDEYVDWHAREVFQGPGRWLPVEEGGAGRSRG